jgi:ribonuclease HII
VLAKYFQKRLWPEAGCDEAGRGCLAGPVFAAAVILPTKFKNEILTDSKRLNEKQRNELRSIIEREAVAYAVAAIDEQTIDQINILKAAIKAMHTALDQLKVRPAHIIVDGNKFINYGQIKHTCIVKGDAKFMSIAAASVLAKTYRDQWMMQLANDYPHYGFDKHKGYGTALHCDAIKKFGYTPVHRKSFVVKSLQQFSIPF